MFRIPPEFNKTLFTKHGVPPPGYLAYVQWFTKPASTPKSRRSHQMLAVTHQPGRPEYSIIETKDIRRNCQLMPAFGEKFDPSWTADNVLDRCSRFHVNNFQDPHAYQSLW